jgi:hypothetical protein
MGDSQVDSRSINSDLPASTSILDTWTKRCEIPKKLEKSCSVCSNADEPHAGLCSNCQPWRDLFTSSTVLIGLSRGSMFPWEVSAVYSRRRIVCSVRRFLRLLFAIFETLTILLILTKSCALSMVHLPVQLSLVTRASWVCSSISARTRKNGNSSVKSA